MTGGAADALTLAGAGPTVLAVSNAAAARGRRGIGALRDALSGSAGVDHRVTETPEQVRCLVGHDRWRPDDLLVVNGGDGSVQLALTALLAHCPPEKQPRIACLPGGTTNMTAFDINGHRRFGDCLSTLRRAIAPAGGVPPAPRRVVRVQRRGGGAEEARCGLFFGIGTIVQGIEYYHARLRGRTGSGELGPGMAMARTLWGMAHHQPPFAEPLGVRIHTAPAGATEGDAVAARLLLATTLDRLFLGMRPFWGEGSSPLKFTLVERRAPAFVGNLPRLLSGHPGRRMSPRFGYHSRRLDALTLVFRGVYTLDGELFANSGDTIDVSATHPVRFLPL